MLGPAGLKKTGGPKGDKAKAQPKDATDTENEKKQQPPFVGAAGLKKTGIDTSDLDKPVQSSSTPKADKESAAKSALPANLASNPLANADDEAVHRALAAAKRRKEDLLKKLESEKKAKAELMEGGCCEVCRRLGLTTHRT